jgi:hypothetical protein
MGLSAFYPSWRKMAYWLKTRNRDRHLCDAGRGRSPQ